MADQSCMCRIRFALVQKRFQPSRRAGEVEGLDSLGHEYFSTTEDTEEFKIG